MYEPPHWTKPRLARIARKPDEASAPPAAKPDEPTIAELHKQLADMKKAYNALWAEAMNMVAELTRRDWALAAVNGDVKFPDHSEKLAKCRFKRLGQGARQDLHAGNIHIDGRQDRS